MFEILIRQPSEQVQKAKPFVNLELGRKIWREMEKESRQGNVGLPSIFKNTVEFLFLFDFQPRV